ncbi:RNA dependent RNA polymerase-domain-containing protein [Lentinula detonsa]|uniref:RNA-dependent RNA polymerase n=1 Tax=Lentinula detonsa TaxID=2804962 RepID=A0AA38UX20_9AGAR|nr:RNA dependent RNA polymerase-domain-containing protein [Lentinula detonsa]
MLSDQSEPAMEISMRYIPHEVDKWELITELANILHKDPFKQSRPDRKLNFDVHLFSHEGGDRCTHTGTGILKVPSKKIGVQFLKHVGDNPVRIRRKKIAFRDNHKSPPERETAMLQKAPWVDPDAEKDREWRMFELGQGPGIRVVTVQFGVLFQDRNARPGESRKYSIEWEKDYTSQGQAWLKFEYDHKLLKIEVGDRLSKTVGSNIILYFANISKIAVGYEYGRAFIIFDTYTPPIFEEVDFYRATTDNARGDRVRFKRRIGSVEHHETHAGVAPFAHTLRLLLPNNNQSDGSDVIDKFRSLCDIAQLNTTIRLAKVEAAGWKFFSGTALRAWTAYTAKHDWPVAFQLESLLHNGILHTRELMDMSPRIEALCEKYGSDYVGDLLRRYPEFLSDPNRLSAETPAQCLERVLSKLIRLKEKTQSSASGIFQCYHAIVTPTRMLLEGPYAGDSNRIIRQYAGYEDHFLRVAFSDEDRMRLRWDREYDGHVFLEERIGGLLKGFELAGRRFEFLAYSTSALREHSVWFMNPFQHHDPSLGVITAQKIRDSIGDFQVPENVEIDPEKPPLLWCPSKYAARLAQAFTSTESSVKIHRREWDIIPDMGREPYLFTDGIGTISESLGDEIWAALCRARSNRGQRAVKPSAYQIRFLGFKGIVAIDRELDNIPGNIRMRLRPSMRKFENSNAEEADIEIALAFENPMVAYFNKALVMILEDRGVERTNFMKLLREAVADAQLVDDSLSKCQAFLALHSFGNVYHLPWILERLAEREAEIIEPHSTSSKKMNIDSKFLKGLRNIARMQVLKEIKHDARILIPDSHLLVGVADEGPAYVNDDSMPEFTDETTYCLSENQIYACIQRPEDKEPTWISGPCLIWRSPLVHLGDAQRVNAVGRPPAGKRNLFGHLKNVVVMPSIGKRSLASCLGGGDLDGDTFTVSTYTGILPPIAEPAAFYPPGSDLNLGRNSTVEDIHNFIIEYFNSDVIGILSDRLLVIADQSQKGFFDPDCKKLATLCSQAVDYPKKGVRVDISGNRLPRPIIRAKPDWHAAEVIGPRKSDYYESTRALGYMYREIKPEDITLPEDLRDPAKPPEFRTERITLLLQDSVLEYLPSFDGHRKSEDIDLLFKNYVDNLRYISAIHTLSNDASVRLTEQEIVLGLILANCSERRWKRDRMYRMRTHTSNLVDETKQGFQPLGRAGNVIEDKEGLLHVLDKAWYAWTRQEVNMFGVNSFKLIALGSVLDCLEKLKSL